MKGRLPLRTAALTVLMCCALTPAAWASPQVVVLPYDTAKPRELRAEVREAVIASGEVNIRKVGDQIYRALPTRVQGGVLVAEVELDMLEAGMYEVLAVTTDPAGFTRSSSVGMDGQPARFEVYERASSSVSLRKGTLRRGSLLVGTVRVGGRAAGQVPLTVERRVQGSDRWQSLGQARSASNGKFRFRVPRGLTGPSGTIRVTVPGGLRRRQSSATRPLVQPSRTSLRVDRTRVRVGQSVTFTGKISTLPVPSAGKVVWLQAYDRGRWVTFARPRSSSTGAWSYSYRFRRSRGVVTYPFRAVLAAQSGFPYGGSVSATVRVRVRGQ